MYVAASSTQTSVISIGYGYVLDMKQLWWSSGGTLGANVVSTNSSFGVDYANCASGSYPVWNDLYNQMGAEGILSACATANINLNVDTQGDVPTGCSSPYIVAVTNTTSADAKNNNAAYGAINVDLGAPGTSILSTYPTNTTGTLTGTSMATPHVSGAVALMHAAASADFHQDYVTYPDSLALVLKQLLLANVDLIPALNGITVSGGRLNLFNAVTAIHAYVGANPTAPNLRYDSHVIDDATGDNDGNLDGGETANLIVTLSNLGANATGVTGTLSETDPYLSISDNSGSFGNIPTSGTADNNADPFVITAAANTPLEYSAQLSLTLNSLEPYTVTRTFNIIVGQKVIYWTDSLEMGEDGWTHSNVLGGFGDNWHVSTEMYSSPSHSWKCGDTGTGNYANSLDAGLVSPLISITPQSALSFHHWIESEQSGTYEDSVYDGAIIEISVNGGAFAQITPSTGYTKTFRTVAGGGNPYTGPMPGLRCWGGAIPWTIEEVNLTPYAGQTIQLRFRFGSDAATSREGWYVDDIFIKGEPPSVPNAVVDLVIKLVGNDMQLLWNAPVGGANSYIIYRDIFMEFVPDLGNQIGTTSDTTYTDIGIVPLEPKVFYQIKAVR
jgi:hypothetical protein